jgi:hypothetical protein
MFIHGAEIHKDSQHYHPARLAGLRLLDLQILKKQHLYMKSAIGVDYIIHSVMDLTIIVAVKLQPEKLIVKLREIESVILHLL